MSFHKGDRYQQQFVVSDSIYENFIETFNDKNPLHTQKSYAQHKGFKDKVMHGNILNGFISYFVGECLPIKNVMIYTQEIQYKRPVFLNDKLFFETVINDIFESVNVVEFKYIFRNSDSVVVSKGKFQIGMI